MTEQKTSGMRLLVTIGAVSTAIGFGLALFAP